MSMRESLYQIEVLNFSRRQNYHSEDVVTKGKGKLKVIDTEPQGEVRTLFKRAKDKELAKRWASGFGSVISCDKVDVTCYLENIEHLNLNPIPIQIVAEQEFTINKDLEITVPKNLATEDVEIIGSSIDKV
jgi:hypothetical protein